MTALGGEAVRFVAPSQRVDPSIPREQFVPDALSFFQKGGGSGGDYAIHASRRSRDTLSPETLAFAGNEEFRLRR